jgi:hypothetical protein
MIVQLTTTRTGTEQTIVTRYAKIVGAAFVPDPESDSNTIDTII